MNPLFLISGKIIRLFTPVFETVIVILTKTFTGHIRKRHFFHGL